MDTLSASPWAGKLGAIEAMRPKIPAPKEMRDVLPALDQPGMCAPMLSARVGVAILQELDRYRGEKAKLYGHALAVCGERGVFFHARPEGAVCFVPLSCIAWVGEHVLDLKNYAQSGWDLRNQKVQFDPPRDTHCVPDCSRPCTDTDRCLILAARLEKVGRKEK